MSENKIDKKISELSNMEPFTLKEKYNISHAQKLLHTPLLDEEWKGSLRKYLKHGKNGGVEVEYTQNDIGRLNIKVKGLKKNEESRCQATMKREIKSALCSRDYVDLDMVNAHPVFAEQVFQSLGYETPCLLYTSPSPRD